MEITVNLVVAFIVAVVIIAVIMRSSFEPFSNRAQVITDKFGARMMQGPPIRYQEFKAAISDGDPVEFDAVRHLTNKRSADPNELASML